MTKEHKSLIKLGILGAGGVVEALHLPVLASFENVRVAWICDKNLARAQRLAAMSSSVACERLDECTDVDAVLMAIPVGYRAEALVECFRRGWNVLSEKPFAPTLKDFDSWVAMAAAAKVHIGVGLMRRFYRNTNLAAALIGNGVFGGIREVVAGEGGHMRATNQPGSWYQGDRRAAGGGVLIETGSHLIDQTLRIVGATGVQLQSCAAEAWNGIEHDARVSALFATKSQSKVPIRFQISRARDVANGIYVRCEHATLHLGTSPESRVSIAASAGGAFLGDVSGSSGATQSYQAFQMEWATFLDACMAGRKSGVSVEDARLSMQLVEQCYEAAGFVERQAEAS